MTLSINEKRTIFQILVLIMKADMVIKQEESNFLDQVFNEFKLSIEEFDHMDDIDLDYLLKEFSELEDMKKDYARQLCVQMANCDGFLDPRESKIIELLS